MDISRKIKEFKIIRNEIIKRIYLQQSIEWYSLINSQPLDSDIFSTLEKQISEFERSSATIDIVNEILNNEACIDKNIYLEAQILKQRISKRVHSEFDIDLSKAKANCYNKYNEAKSNSDYKIVENALGDLIKIKKEHCCDYQAVLREKITDLAFSEIDELFSKISKNAIFLASQPQRVIKASINKSQSDNIVQYLLGLMSIDQSKIVVANFDEPFMMSFGSRDVRAGLNFNECNLINFLKHTCHEFGHVLYEQNNDSSLNNTFLSGGASTTFNEGMAYFFEHYLAENPKFQKFIIDKLNIKSSFINNSGSLLRINSNDKEYPLHVLIRYEIEKELFNGNISVKDINDAWKQKYSKYLNLNVCNDLKGVLQDPHWYNAQFGYFPAYVIGRVYASQVYNTINKLYNFEECLNSHNLKEPIAWLSENIYKFGASKSPNEILNNSLHQNFNSDIYLDDILSK